MSRITIVAALAMASAISAASPKTAALEGLDPVLLTDGQEVSGKDSITFEYGRFLYQFASDESRTRFKNDPERYGVQLDGACARMGAPVSGSADAYFVYNHRIYVFGSNECYRRFSANPKKYLEAEQPKPAWDPTAETRAQARMLLEKTIAVMGGASKWQEVESYAETRQPQGQNSTQTIKIAVKLPDSLVRETSSGDTAYGQLVTPQTVLGYFRGTAHRLPESFGRAILAESCEDVLPILLRRLAPDFDVYYAGRAGNTERLQINDRGRISTLLRDGETGKIVGTEWHGPSAAGYVTYHISYSDYRAVGGLQLPFRAEGSTEGNDEPLPASHSWTILSYELNPRDVDGRLRPAVSIVEP